MLALEDPTLLCRRGELLDLAREKVVESGYAFVKGKSRSKKLSVPDTPVRSVRKKISTEVRLKRIKSLKEEIANLDEQIKFKEKRREQSEAVRNYKLCEDITQEIGIVKQQWRELSGELATIQDKQRKAKWYAKKRQEKS